MAQKLDLLLAKNRLQRLDGQTAYGYDQAPLEDAVGERRGSQPEHLQGRQK